MRNKLTHKGFREDGMKKTVAFLFFVLFLFITIAFFLSFAAYSHAITITGSETITTNSSASYTAADCSGAVSWSVTGTGASISSNGVLTTGPASCGGITVTASCSDGSVATKTARVTDAGHWILTSSCNELTPIMCGWGFCCVTNVYTGKYRYDVWCYLGSVSAGCNAGSCSSHGVVCSSLCGSSGYPCNSSDPNIIIGVVSNINEWQCPTCTNGQTISCYTGTGGTQGIGECKSGTQTCVNGQWGACTGEVLPATEVCGDNMDNNCDGQVDEDCNVQKSETTLGKDPCTNIPPTNITLGSSANPASGNLYHDQTLFQTATSGFTLSYNSIDIYNGSLGKGWTHNYNLLLFSNPDGSIGLKQGDGNVIYFRLTNGIYYPEANSGDTSYITVNSDNTFTRTLKNNTTYNFRATGKLTSIKDRNNNTTTLTYTGDNLTTITDPSGRATYLTYDSTNKITGITEPSNNSYSLTYSNNMLTQISTASSQLGTLNWAYTYDTNNQLLTKTDPMGYVTTYAYDANNKVVSSTDPEGKTKSITYDTVTNTATATEKDGGIWTYKYDSLLNVTTQKTDPLGNTTTYTYDSNRNLITETDPLGSTTIYTYDTSGNRTSATNALGNTTAYTYNTFGQITSITDSQNKVTTYTYDAKGNLLTTTDASGAVTQYQYDSKGNLIQLITPNSQLTTLTYDQYNNPITITDPTGAVTTFTYDISGNLLTLTDAQGHITRLEYNSLNKPIKVTDPLNNITTNTYDKNGNKISVTDANGNTTNYGYNYRGQVTKATDALSAITTFAYGSTGCSSCGGGGDKLTTVTDAKANTTTFQYDLAGRLIKETGPLGNITAYAYDPNGNLKTKTDANANTITYSYDAVNRLTQKLYPDGNMAAYQYNANSSLTYAGNQYIAYNFTYDANKRIISSIDSAGKTLQYTYDANSNRTSMTDPTGGITSYAYNALNLVASITNPSGKQFGFTYDSLGRRTKLRHPNVVQTTYTYDSNSRLTSLITFNSKLSTLNSFTYTHDNVGNRTTMTESAGTHNYAYDVIYQLTQATHPKPPSEQFTYDPVGNRANTTVDTANRLLEDAAYLYTYDANGNLIRKVRKTNGETTTFSYDFENRLIQLLTPNSQLITYTYDPFGRRLEKNVNGTIKSYLYDNEDILAEYDGSGVLTTKYTHGPGIDEPLAMERAGQSYYYHADGLGSIKTITDSTGKVVQKYEYNSFGRITYQLSQTFIQPYTFTGREFDPETGLYYYRGRYYYPSRGRFISKDPIGFGGGDVNLYRYVGNNPVNFVDPEGLAASQCCNFSSCFENCYKQSGGLIALGILGVGSPFASVPYPGNKLLLGSKNPFTSLASITLRSVGLRGSAIALRVVNPYANVAAVGTASYAGGLVLSCSIYCKLDCSMF
ncbi:MAG: RHS repeat protein [Nitrospirae bacterium]|nr:RHS repeat protein [Nitrospirota bacterium]